MAIRLWLDRGTSLNDGSKTKKLIAHGDNWQIMSTSYDGLVLIVKSELYEKWVNTGLIDESLFLILTLNDIDYHIFVSKQGYLISSIESGPYPYTNIEARGFAVAMRETRKIISSVSLHDALYIEQFSRLLPTYTLTESFDDKTVLGTWLSAGVLISVNSYRRLCKLLEWMDSKEVATIIADAGFNLENNIYLSELQQHEDFKSKDLQEDIKFSLPGRPQLEAFFNEHIVEIIAHEEQYKRMGINFPSAIVLYGPPGCGKTYAIERLVEFLDWPSYSIESSSIGSPYIHDTSKKISEVFDNAINNAPSIVVIDEMEAFLANRNDGTGLYHVEEVAEFLRRIPEAARNRVLVIAMTNMIEAIDPAILRRGRFDHIIEVTMPSTEEIRLLLINLLSKLPTIDNIDLDNVIKELQGKPVSDIAFVIKEAARMAVKQGKDKLDDETIHLSIKSLPNDKNIKHRIGFSE